MALARRLGGESRIGDRGAQRAAPASPAPDLIQTPAGAPALPDPDPGAGCGASVPRRSRFSPL